MQIRTKMSPPPALLPTEQEVTVLAGFVRNDGYSLMVDEIHRFAIEQEIEVYVTEIGDSRATLERVYMARAAWLVLDRIQQRVQRAVETLHELRSRPITEQDERSERNHRILGTE